MPLDHRGQGGLGVDPAGAKGYHSGRRCVMTDEQTSETSTAAESTSHNRYILLAVIGCAVLVAIFLLKTNMEPPKPSSADMSADAGASPDSAPDDTVSQQMMQDVQKQMAHLQDVLAKDSSNFDAWVALGNLYYDANMADEAVSHYRRALAIHPDDLNVMTDLATMEREAGHPDDAVTILRQVLAADSTRAQTWFNLGVIYSFDLKDQKEAVIAWKRFLALSPPSEHTDAVKHEIERLEKELGM
ncbi:MAG: tetratricopeptide repeat protein [candidate division Zixibacteria bacterium]|nr:tetratricopeptide repeat protein [candidate division Zixibacteria bacterium]